MNDIGLVTIDEIPPMFRNVFQYQYFNKVQSIVFQDVFYTDKSIVVSAPTGSGKTVILELAIIRLLIILKQLNYAEDFKIVYMAPVKALCTERLVDWYAKFTQLGLPCIEVTGDTDFLDIPSLKNYKIIMTTPEKWDSLTRRWKDHERIVQTVKLFFIDEVHLLKEEVRGSVLEAVVSRMKTIQESIRLSVQCKGNDNDKSTLPFDMRFIAISATIPNAHDIAEWLGTKHQPAAAYIIGDEYRPVTLKKVVEGYPCKDGLGLFKFDMGLSYKIRPIIEKYCDGKPTLIFCNTRKSVEMTADILSKDLMFQFTDEQKEIFFNMSTKIVEKKLQVLIKSGIGCHHAGFIQQDRNIIEEMFRQGDLPLLVTTSTLAMGVNLPAHLVIIKTTYYYNQGSYQEYDESTILQMMGRAGRPQFDNEGVAVIMTKMQDKDRYTRLVGGQRAIESSLHRNLSEHLNAEVALGTLLDLIQAMDWIRSTFLYIRAVKNPTYYGFPAQNDRNTIEKRLEEICLKNMNALARAGMIIMDADTFVQSTEAGQVMAANCLDFETMKLIMKIKGNESLEELLVVLSKCHEFSEIPLRNGEKRLLNLLNRKPKGMDDNVVCRFPQRGRIQTKEMKVNCLFQAVLGCLPIPDPSLYQESIKVTRTGERISKCIMKYLTRKSNVDKRQLIYKAVLYSVILYKCFVAKLWNNSTYISKQFPGIGLTFASLLASAGKITFQSILDSNPRDIERIINKHPPTGNTLKKQVSLLPKYDLNVIYKPNRSIVIEICIRNSGDLVENGSTAGEKHKVALIVGDSDNHLLYFNNIWDTKILNSSTPITTEITPISKEAHTVYIHCISHTWVGLDINTSIEIKQSLNSILGPLQRNIQQYLEKTQNKVNKDMAYNATLSPTIQNSFLQDEYDTNISEEKKNKNQKEQTPASKKLNRGCSKLNELIKTIPEPSQLNTLSSDVSYYKTLPKRLRQNSQEIPTIDKHFNNLDKTQFSNTPIITNTDQLKIYYREIPNYIKNMYSKNGDDSFNNWRQTLEKETNEASDVLFKDLETESNISFIEEKRWDNSESVGRIQETFHSDQSICNINTENIELEDDNDLDNNIQFNCDTFKINKEYETFALDRPADTQNVSPFKEINFTDDMNGNIDISISVNKGIVNIANTDAKFVEFKKESNSNIPIISINNKKNNAEPYKKTNTINSYYKHVKKTNSPTRKRMKLDIQYTDPTLKPREDKHLLNLSDSHQGFNETEKTISETHNYNKFNNIEITNISDSHKFNISTNIPPDSHKVYDNSNIIVLVNDDKINTIDNMADQKVENAMGNEIKAASTKTTGTITDIHDIRQNIILQQPHNYNIIEMSNNDKNYQSIGKENDMQENNIEEIDISKDMNKIDINFHINIDNTLNQLFNINNSDSQICDIMNIPSNSDISLKNNSMTLTVPLVNIVNNISNNDKNILQVNADYLKTLQICAISKIKEKMQEICQLKKLPIHIKNKFLDAINSVTDLSSSELVELYSIKKLNALQDIVKNKTKGATPGLVEEANKKDYFSLPNSNINSLCDFNKSEPKEPSDFCEVTEENYINSDTSDLDSLIDKIVDENLNQDASKKEIASNHENEYANENVHIIKDNSDNLTVTIEPKYENNSSLVINLNHNQCNILPNPITKTTSRDSLVQNIALNQYPTHASKNNQNRYTVQILETSFKKQNHIPSKETTSNAVQNSPISHNSKVLNENISHQTSDYNLKDNQHHNIISSYVHNSNKNQIHTKSDAPRTESAPNLKNRESVNRHVNPYLACNTKHGKSIIKNQIHTNAEDKQIIKNIPNLFPKVQDSKNNQIHKDKNPTQDHLSIHCSQNKNETNGNIQSILQKYLHNPTSMQNNKQYSAERTNFSNENQNNLFQYKPIPNIQSFLTFADQNVVKHYQDNHCKTNFNTINNIEVLINNSEDTQNIYYDSDSSIGEDYAFESEAFLSQCTGKYDNNAVIKETILDPQKVLASLYSDCPKVNDDRVVPSDLQCTPGQQYQIIESQSQNSQNVQYGRHPTKGMYHSLNDKSQQSNLSSQFMRNTLIKHLSQYKSTPKSSLKL